MSVSPPAAPLRAAVVGCGFQGRLHLECLADVPDVEVVAVCDRDGARAAEVARRFGVPAHHDGHERLLAEHELDLLTICTMPDSHRDVAVAALAAGAHVLCEKPLALDLAEGREMVAAARAADRHLSVGFNLRYTTAAEAVRDFVRDGSLGRPVCARGWMLADDVPWWGRHHVKALSGGGALAATAVHMIDLLTWLAGNPTPVTATASAAQVFPRKRGAGAPSAAEAAAYDVEDLLFGHVRFDDGFFLNVEGAWVWDEPGWDYSFTLVGDRGQARLDPLRLTAERDGKPADVTGAATGEVDFATSTARWLHDVVSAVRAGRAPRVTGVQALQVQAIVDALYRSAAERREVDVERIDDDEEE